MDSVNTQTLLVVWHAFLLIHPGKFRLIDENTDTEISSKFRDYLEQNLPEPNTKKIYFDYGNLTGDAFYKPYQSKIDKKSWAIKAIVVLSGKPFFEGESHNGNILGKRLGIPVLFLLKPLNLKVIIKRCR
jgi:hypothetical protein